MIDVRIDKDSAVPIFRQIEEVILAGIASGKMAAGDKLPTIRDLAVHVGVNPNTVAKAYSRLQLLGALWAKRGAGVFVSESGVKQPSKRERERTAKALCRDFAARGELKGVSVDELIDGLRKMRGRG